ncbi:hypothetical protein BLNAU_17476 [Blattamonas nauphoetae]|uniref:Uncharacterized protein n=1 Tax=Blattamonas nauphoetae TaxID=2049346 RepID=A0ABQ9X717_9EUKA|nr:hypothetical protein BLNAU_17476 [Blattamonas nauphoetae]
MIVTSSLVAFTSDLIFNSLKLNHQALREAPVIAITNIVINYPWMKDQIMTSNLVGRMFETVDFVSLPLSESNTLSSLAKLITVISQSTGNGNTFFDQYRLIRVSVSEKLLLDEQNTIVLEPVLFQMYHHLINMELRSDEHDADIITEIVKWEMRTMVEMENENRFQIVFRSLLSRTSEWNRNLPERQKRRERLLREEGWDDAFELRVVGIDVNSDWDMQYDTKRFSVELGLNVDEL